MSKFEKSISGASFAHTGITHREGTLLHMATTEI